LLYETTIPAFVVTGLPPRMSPPTSAPQLTRTAQSRETRTTSSVLASITSLTQLALPPLQLAKVLVTRSLTPFQCAGLRYLGWCGVSMDAMTRWMR
jgi:hypothetical protein